MLALAVGLPVALALILVVASVMRVGRLADRRTAAQMAELASSRAGTVTATVSGLDRQTYDVMLNGRSTTTLRRRPYEGNV